MLRVRSLAKAEADLVSLRTAAERAGFALGGLFSAAGEEEPIEARRAAAMLASPRDDRRVLRTFVLTGILAFVFLML